MGGIPDDRADEPYSGIVGATRQASIHYTCPCGTMVAVSVYRSVDVRSHPALGERLLAGDPAQALNTVRCPGGREPVLVAIPVVYHDPDRRLLALVLPEAARHRELEERAALLAALAAEPVPVPPYARDFAVVFGPAGLRALLGDEGVAGPEAAPEWEAAIDPVAATAPAIEPPLAAADREAAAAAAPDTAPAADLAAAAAATAPAATAVSGAATAPAATAGPRAISDAAAAAEIAALRAELSRCRQELADTRRALEARTRELEAHSLFAGQGSHDEPAPAPQAAEVTMIARVGEEAIEVEPAQLGEGGVLVADQRVDSDRSRAPMRMRQHSDEATLVGSLADMAVAHWLTTGAPTLKVMGDRGTPRIAVRAGAADLAHLSSEGLEVRVQLHRFASGPLVVLALGTAASLSGRSGAPAPVPVLFDLDASGDRAVLEALSRRFVFTLDLHGIDQSSGQGGDQGSGDAGAAAPALVRRRSISGDLAGNVRYILAAASNGDPGPGRTRSFADSARAFAAPDYDRYGWRHPERHELREDKLGDLTSAQRVRRALAVADRFTAPRREAYLFLLRGYPVQQWQARRRAVLDRALALGLWMGPRLAQVAVSEGLARSRRDLLRRLQQGFQRLQAGDPANDLDQEAILDNQAALDAEAAALERGSASPARGKPAGVPAAIPARAPERGSIAALLADLAHSQRRLDAAMSLTRLGELRFADPVMDAVEQMGREQAVQVLARMAAFGPGATDVLRRGLASNKGYVRQGAALALALIGGESAVEALSDALLAEPTAVWREIARSLGRVGPPAILPLASRLTHILARGPAAGTAAAATAAAETAGADEQAATARERVAWALAHVAARGGTTQVTQLADSRDPVGAAVARQALELADSARDDDRPVQLDHGTDGHTLHRAFSRQFFEIARTTSGASTHGTIVARAPSAPAMVLDEADILETSEDSGRPLDVDDETPK